MLLENVSIYIPSKRSYLIAVWQLSYKRSHLLKHFVKTEALLLIESEIEDGRNTQHFQCFTLFFCKEIKIKVLLQCKKKIFVVYGQDAVNDRVFQNGFVTLFRELLTEQL